MASHNSIKLFEFNQKYCQIIGIRSVQSNQMRAQKLNAMNWIYISFATQYVTASAAFLLFDAKSLRDYGITFVAMITTISAMVDYFILMWKMGNFLNFIEMCERFIETSK